MKKDAFLRLVETLEMFFPSKEVLYVFEMGARDCSDTLKFDDYYPNTKTYTFECNPETLPICRETIKNKERICLTEKAVSDEDGKTIFYPIDAKKTSTPHKDGSPGASSLFKASGKYPVEQCVQKEITVPTTRLDTFMTEKDIPGIDILWLDVQGAELKGLRGLGKKIRTVRAIQTEVEFMETYRGEPRWKEVKKFLKQNGFTFVKFSIKGKYSGDAIFVNKDTTTFKGRIKRIIKIRTGDFLDRVRQKFIRKKS